MSIVLILEGVESVTHEKDPEGLPAAPSEAAIAEANSVSAENYCEG